MAASIDTDLIIKSIKIEDKNFPTGIWMNYEDTSGALSTTRYSSNTAYLGGFLQSPMTPSQIFVRQRYTSLSFNTDFVVGSNTTATSERTGVLSLSFLKNKIYVTSYNPSHLTDVFTFKLYSSDNVSSKQVILPITISSVDVVPTVLQGNPTINTLNNKYTGLTMLFSEGGVEAGTLTTSSYESSVSNVSFSNGACTFDYTTPTTQTSDSLVFTSFRAADTHAVNTSPYLFQITNLLEQPRFSSWVYSPGSQSFPYTGIDSLIAVFNKNISTCTSITSSSGSPTTIIPISIIGKQVKFAWTSLTTGNVTFTFNGLTSTDGTIDASVDGLTVAGPIILNTPATIVGWTVIQPTEANTLYNLSVVFNKQLSNSRIPIITATEGIVPVFTSVTGSQVNFTVTTSATPSTTIYSLKNVSGLDGSIRSENASISAGAKINSVDVETDLAGSFLTMANLVILRTQKVKIILSKAISGTLSLVPNANCTFGAVTMINSSTAQFTITPADKGVSSLTIQTNNIISQDGSQSTLSYVFNLVYGQTIVNLFESLNKNSVKTNFDINTLVSLSLQMSKPILSDLTDTTITCSNGTVTNLSISTILGKYYYNFDFTPSVNGTGQTLYLNQAKDSNNFKYTISYGGLTFANPYVFPTAFNFLATNNGYINGAYLLQGVSSSLIMTFTGGNNLFSNTIETQISYVKYIQDNVEIVVSPSMLSCSNTLNTITINSITPLSSNDLTVKVKLKSPSGSVGSEITNTIMSNKFANPISALNVTAAYIPTPYKLVYNYPVNLSFNFNTATAFPSDVVSLFYATVNGSPLSLTNATANGVSLVLSYTALSAIQYNFVFFAFNQQFNFVVQSSEVYTYKDIIKTTRNIPTVSIGQSLTLKSNFISSLPASMTASVIVTPEGYSPVTYQATLTAGTLLDFASPTWYYPFTSNIQNYASGVGVTDTTIGVGGYTTGGSAAFSDGLVLTGSSTHNAANASYIVLPTSSSGNIAAFSCWFKSNNNANYTRIIDMATNGTFRLYVTGSNSLNFNDVYTLNTSTPINNNTWNFIAINTTATTLNWVLNSGDTGNYGSGSISSKPVNFNLSVGYLGHSFGGDPEFAGSLKEVSFYSNANLTSQQISGLYMGTTRVSIDHTVAYDVIHSGSVQLFYGSTNKVYTWASDTLTSSNIYTFPSSFSIDGTSNGYSDGAKLKAGTSGSLKLTFSGGDMLYSSVVSTQVSYVKYVQSGVETIIAPNLLSCSDPLETITISAITPTNSTDLTIKVKLIGPDGVIGAELSSTVFASEFDGVVIPLTFRTPGGLQNTTTLGTLLLNDRQWKNGSNSVYQGVVVKKAFISDFTIVIKFGSEYSAHAMVCSPYASPLDFVLNSTNYYTTAGCLQNFQPTGSYSYSIPLHFYNSSTFYPGQNFSNSSTTHYKYRRSGNYISLSYCNSGATGPWTLITSATIQTTDRVVCLIGECLGYGSPYSATIISEAYNAGIKSIYNIDQNTLIKTSGFSSDSSSASLILALPLDSQTEVSSQINTSTNAKTITWRSGYITTSTSQYYGSSYMMRTTTTPDSSACSILVSGFSTPMETYFNNNFTIEMWIRPTINPGWSSGNVILQTGNWGEPGQIQMAIESLDLTYSSGNLGRITMYNRIAGVGYYGTRVITSNTWQHFAFVRTGSTFVMYINGVSCLNMPAWTMQSMTKFCIGGLNLGGYEYQEFFGQVQDIRMYSTAKYTDSFMV